MTYIVSLLLLLLAVAVITDLRSNKIPNLLIVIGLVIGIVTTNHFFSSISIFVLSILIFFPAYKIGALGAGDIKCIAMMSFYLTQQELLWTLFYSFLTAAGYAVCKMAYYRSYQMRENKIRLAFFLFLGTLISVGGAYL